VFLVSRFLAGDGLALVRSDTVQPVYNDMIYTMLIPRGNDLQLEDV
jgi:hypothetical protein